ncbi:hypothetical protein [Pedobacter sp. UYP1]|uniref:hypothetical protein n=1 Tax=Pedobacter sp. UYP1 TaxID=1756396 RepID=UPI00339564D4
MKLVFKSPNPDKLKSDIIKKTEDGELKTWTIYESDGVKYLKHTQQWGDKGVIQLTVDKVRVGMIVEVLRFEKIKEEVKDFEGYYYGRFCEIIFVNFPFRFTSIDRL